MSLISLKGSEPIAGYQITERLGAGGYGEVWKADAPGGLSKAIKFIYGYLNDEKASRELKALNRIKQIRHPFLLSLERIEVIEGQLLIVTELADSSLKDRFQACLDASLPAIPRDELLAYLRDAADGLDFLSENALQHLDVKPENLLLVGGRIKVADFGLVKDIQDRTCSMMGGMTPVYAPPEVFDGRPCSYSDQYSLAIVYQEMVTGTLPFPGNTAAQLASQHLHSRPRLESLPEVDRSVIARALSKNPADRYPSARAMVEALLAAGNHRPGSIATPGEPRTVSGDTTSAAAQDTSPAMQPAGDLANPNRRSGSRSRSGSRWESNRAALSDSAPRPGRDSQAPAVIVSLPPVEITAQDNGLRPTLFLGIGGTGAEVLRRLQRKFVDRFGDLGNVPALQMLVLDTSGHAARTATAAELQEANRIPKIEMPLRRPQDYRADSGEILQWLCRRWLYNIPRSLETEGLRPLGRLALVDHADKLFNALQTALVTCTSSDSLATSKKNTGLAIRSESPRVFIVASISGGTGSGMVLDAAYAVRMVLDELKLPKDGICGVLAHSTSRVADGKELATANAFSCLSELHHFSRHPYPGEPSCGLPEAEDGQPPFDDTYFVHLGDRLTDPQFAEATDSLAAYLYLNAATGAGAYFDKCRAATSRDSATSIHVRSLGLCQMGCKKDLSTSATEALCKALIQRWAGDPQSGKQPGAGRLTGQDPVTKWIEQFKLDATSLLQRFRAQIQKAMQPDPNTALQRIVKTLVQEEPSETASEPDDVRWLRLTKQAERMLGLTEAEEPSPFNSPLKLNAAAEALHPRYLDEAGQSLNKELLQLAADREFRLSGAHDVARRLVERLRLVEKELTTLLQPMHQQLSALLAGAQGSAPTASRGKRSSRESGLAASALGQALFTHCCLTVEQLAIASAVRVVRSLTQRMVAVSESFVNVRRDVMQLANQFAADDSWNDTTSARGPADGSAADADEAVRNELRRRFSSIADQFERRVDDELLTPCGGLARFVTKSADQLQLLPSALRAGARSEVLRALKEVDVARLVLGPLSEASQESLQQFMQAAWPKALDTGGAKRLLLVMPDSATAAKLPELIEKSRQEKATVVTGPGGEVVACYEAEQLDLTRVAAALVADDPNFIGVAKRLHTRTDVQWTALA